MGSKGEESGGSCDTGMEAFWALRVRSSRSAAGCVGGEGREEKEGHRRWLAKSPVLGRPGPPLRLRFFRYPMENH